MKVQIEKGVLKSLTLTAATIEARDAYTGGHLWRVSQYSQKLAQAIGMTSKMIFMASLGGFLHDIGKIGIPDAILSKRGELTEVEYEVVKTHPGIGATLIHAHPLGGLAISAVHQHHEWVNGAGYPNELCGEEISDFARIVSIADAFDALTSSRPYRQRVGTAAAVAALNKEYGSQFDPHQLERFIKLAETGALDSIMAHSEFGVPMVMCSTCGPVITVTRDTRDGDWGYCRVCGKKHRLHRQADTFVVEPTGEKGTAEQLKPCPEMGTIEAFIHQAPQTVAI